MDEFQFISQITQESYRQAHIVKGIGDDAAVFRSLGEDLVIAVDTFVEGIHFTEQTLSPEQLGYRVLAVNLSDMAAMGAEPRAYLVSLVATKKQDQSFYRQIYSGMEGLASKYGIDLIGGDTVLGKELAISITVLGSVPRDKARYRSEAKPGDLVFVTGTLGDSRAGLQLLLDSTKTCHLPTFSSWEKSLIARHQKPTPRVDFATNLRPLKRVALNDISDGIANELYEIAGSSNVTITIDDRCLPISDELRNFPRSLRDEWKLFGGEDFELVGTVAEEDFPFVTQIGNKLDVQVTKIGTVSYNESGKGKVFLFKNGVKKRLKKRGYIHRSGDSNDEVKYDK